MPAALRWDAPARPRSVETRQETDRGQTRMLLWWHASWRQSGNSGCSATLARRDQGPGECDGDAEELLPQLHCGEPGGFLAVVLNFKLVVLVELDFAGAVQ